MEPTIAFVAVIVVFSAVALYGFFVRERLIRLCRGSEMGKAAGAYQRIGLAIIIVVSCWLLANYFLIELLPASRYVPYADRVVLGLAFTLGWLAWSRSRHAPAVGLSRALAGATVVAAIAFVMSALSGPILFPSKWNQGVLMGLNLIAPAFGILGGVGSLFAWSIRAESGRTV